MCVLIYYCCDDEDGDDTCGDDGGGGGDNDGDDDDDVIITIFIDSGGSDYLTFRCPSLSEDRCHGAGSCGLRCAVSQRSVKLSLILGRLLFKSAV